MYFFPKLYKTISCDNMRFVIADRNHRFQGMWKWQQVRKLFWFVWVNKNEIFYDWPNMFYLEKHNA